jgi:nicotinamide mononucleotide adenylyltransferase
MTFRFLIASVHGRFQPPHLDHLTYIEAGLAASKHLIIGITQPEIVALAACPEDPHRAEASSNPFTYEQRCEMIKLMLSARNVSSTRFSFRRFPIEVPARLAEHITTDVVCLTTIRDQWNLTKVERLRSIGYSVEVLWDKRDVPGIQGTKIREKIRAGDTSWRSDVHPSVAEFIIANSNKVQL